MGLRCTVFGHKWGDAATEREREEDGDEVVATVREVRTCRRCGAEDVLGTSKEVRTLASRTGSDREADESSTRDAEFGDEESYDPEADDGVILDEDGDAGGTGDDGRSREWPNHPDRDGDADDSDEPVPWPETAREPEDDRREERFVGADRQTEGGDHGELSPDERSRGERSPHERSHAEPGDDPAADDEGTGPVGGQPDSPVGEREAGGEGGEIIEAGTADEAEVDEDAGTVDGDEDAVDGVHGGSPSDAGGEERPAEDDVSGAPEDAERGGTGAEDAGGDGTGDRPADESAPAPGPGDAPEDRDGTSPAESDRQPGDGDASSDEETLMGPDASHRPDDDAEVLESTEPNEQSRATAREPVDPTDHASAGESAPSEAASSGSTSRPSLDPSEPASGEDPAPEDVEYYCSECDYVDDSKWPSRRAGDVCPNCRRSYLSERRC